MAKILYVGNFSPISVGEPEIANALEEHGHEVTRVEFKEPLDNLYRMAKEHDIFFCSKFSVPSPLAGREFIEHLQIPSVSWSFDLYFGYHREARVKAEPHFCCDYVFTTDGGHQRMFEQAGVKHFVLRQGIEKGVKPGKPVYPTKAKIAFIGSLSPWSNWTYRQDLVSFLRERYGDDFEHFGEQGNIRHEELNNLIATVPIIIGDSVHSPRYWSNRIYEMLGRGAFLIHPKIKGLEEEFEYYKHFIPYRYGDFSGLAEKIDYYLPSPTERHAISKAGYDYCHKHYTYTDRVGELLKILKKEKVL